MQSNGSQILASLESSGALSRPRVADSVGFEVGPKNVPFESLPGNSGF